MRREAAIRIDPARVEWMRNGEVVGKWWKRNGYYCFIKRFPFLFGKQEFFLNGYVNIPPEEQSQAMKEKDWFDNLSVHGGVTYFKMWGDGIITVGWDTKHGLDYDPIVNPGGHKWTKKEVREETNNLADKIAEKASGLGALFG